jgi:hypothetical protein
MPEAVFVGGVPARITPEDFRRHYLASFPKLASREFDDRVKDAIDTVYGMFTGVGNLWDKQPSHVWFDKTRLCYRLLTAWYITDRMPGLAAEGGSSVDGLILKERRVDGVALKFDPSLAASKASGMFQDVLSGLRTNDWGRKALMMIQASGKRASLLLCNYV